MPVELLKRRFSPFGGKIQIVIQGQILGDVAFGWPWKCNEALDPGKAFHLVQVLTMYHSR